MMQCPASLSSDDFDLFWEWLILSNNSRMPADETIVATTKVIRVFITLNMFENRQLIDKFIESWCCQQIVTVTYEELEVGLSMLSDSQYIKFHRFVLALHTKDVADQKTAQLKKLEIEKQKKKLQQKSKSLSLRNLREDLLSKNALVHPRQSSLVTSESNIYYVNKKKNDKEPSSARSFITRAVSFIKRSFSSSSLSTGRSSSGNIAVSPFTLPEEQIDLVDNSTSAFINTERETFSARITRSNSGDGFTARLSMANLSIFRVETCSNERMNSYRICAEPSVIEESLVSFDDSLDNASEW
jgi:hypothetical protein